MSFFLKVILVVAGATLLFFGGLIIYVLLGTSPVQLKIQSEIKSIAVYVLPSTDASFPKDALKSSDSTYPMVFVLHLEIDDSTLNRAHNISPGFMMQSTYAVDPGRIMEYSYSSKISGLRILSFFKNDTTDITREFTIRSKDSYDQALDCYSSGVGEKMMEKISDGRVRTENFLLQHHNQHPKEFDNLKFELILENGTILEAVFSPGKDDKALTGRK